MTYRSSLAICLLVLAALVLAACGSATTVTPAKPPASAPPTAAPAKPASTTAPAATAAPAATTAAKTEAAKLEKVSFALVTHGAQYYGLYAAIANGYFKAENLDLEITMSGSAATTLQGLVSGSFDVGPIPADSFLVPVSQAQITNLRIIGSAATTAPYVLLAQPQFKTVADLKGKTLGATNLKTGDGYFLRFLIGQYGLKEPDYSVIMVGGNPEKIAAMQAAKIDGVTVFEPFVTQLADMGKVKLASLADFLKDWEYISFLGNTNWLKDHPDAAVRFLRAYIKGVDYVYEPANKNEAIQIYVAATRTEPKFAQAGHETFVGQRIIPKNAEVNQKGIPAQIAALKELGQLGPNSIDVANVVDLAPLQKAKASLGR